MKFVWQISNLPANGASLDNNVAVLALGLSPTGPLTRSFFETTLFGKDVPKNLVISGIIKEKVPDRQKE